MSQLILMGGMIVCRKCQRGYLTLQDVGMVHTDGELCPLCRGEVPALTTQVYEAPPWATANAEPKVSAAAALDELLEEVQRDEKDWTLTDKIDMAIRVEEERSRHPRKRKP